jgi:hypothetical protein
MQNIEFITSFLGWCSVINIGILLFSTVVIVLFKETISKIHASIFGINREQIADYYFQYLGNYKIAVIILNIVPYLALRLMV